MLEIARRLIQYKATRKKRKQKGKYKGEIMKTSCRGRSLIIHKKIFPIVRNKANNSTAAHPAPGLLPRPSRERDILKRQSYGLCTLVLSNHLGFPDFAG